MVLELTGLATGCMTDTTTKMHPKAGTHDHEADEMTEKSATKPYAISWWHLPSSDHFRV
jgi:hypothetical protein